jgi:CotS family spore coat protein
MPEAFRENLESILAEYPIKTIDIKTESYKNKKGVWWIKTTEGCRILKKHSNSAKTLDFIIAAVEYLQNNGIRLPEIIPAADGGKYVLRDGSCYVLYRAVSGINPGYGSGSLLKRIVLELAKFHRASKGFVPPKDCKPRIHLGKWPDTYRQRNEKLISYHAYEIAASVHDDFGEMIIKDFPYFIKRAEDAIDGLEDSYYRQWSEDLCSIGCLCHQDFAAGNLILTDAGEMYVLDVDSITLDIPVKDIRKLLLKVMKKRGGWDLTLTRDMLEWYHGENPLEYPKWQVLKWELFYPHLFSGIMTKYYEKREKTWTQAKYVKRLREMIDVEKSIRPVIEGFDDLIPQ